jgi:hypothetical protein
MKRIPGALIILVYLFYLYFSVHNLFGDTDPVLIGLDLFCGATCLGGIALFVALILEGKLSAAGSAMGHHREHYAVPG